MSFKRFIKVSNILLPQQKTFQKKTFRAGDIVRVILKTAKGKKIFQGTCSAKRESGKKANFTVRATQKGQELEKTFPLHSPLIHVEVVKQGADHRPMRVYLKSLKKKENKPIVRSPRKWVA